MQRQFTSGSRQAPDPLDQFLEMNNFYRKHTARDSSCLFRVISEQLYDTQQHHLMIRKECVRYMRKHKDYFQPLVDRDLDEYLDDLSKPRTYGSLVELQAVGYLFQRNVLLFEPFNLGNYLNDRTCFTDVFRVFYTPERHFDSVFTSEYIKDAAICQAICYELLYKDVFQLPDVSLAVEHMLHAHSFDSDDVATDYDDNGYCTRLTLGDGRVFDLDTPQETNCILEDFKLCHFHYIEFPRFAGELQRELAEYAIGGNGGSGQVVSNATTKHLNCLGEFNSTIVNSNGDGSKGQSLMAHKINMMDCLLPNKYISCVRQLLQEGITPFPYKVAKALDPNIYRNIEFDAWNEMRKEAKLSDLYYGDSNFKVGAKCHVRLYNSEKDLYTCHIQEMDVDNGYCVVYVEKLGEKRMVPYEALSPLPSDQFKPWSLPYRLQRHMNKYSAAAMRYSRHYNYSYRYKFQQHFSSHSSSYSANGVRTTGGSSPTAAYCDSCYESDMKPHHPHYITPTAAHQHHHHHRSSCYYKLQKYTHLEDFRPHHPVEYCTMPLTVDHTNPPEVRNAPGGGASTLNSRPNTNGSTIGGGNGSGLNTPNESNSRVPSRSADTATVTHIKTEESSSAESGAEQTVGSSDLISYNDSNAAPGALMPMSTPMYVAAAGPMPGMEYPCYYSMPYAAAPGPLDEYYNGYANGGYGSYAFDANTAMAPAAYAGPGGTVYYMCNPSAYSPAAAAPGANYYMAPVPTPGTPYAITAMAPPPPPPGAMHGFGGSAAAPPPGTPGYYAAPPTAGTVLAPGPPPQYMLPPSYNGGTPSSLGAPRGGNPLVVANGGSTTPLNGRINFEAKKSTRTNGSDLPTDMITLRYFYNLGLEYHHRQQQARREGKTIDFLKYTDDEEGRVASALEDSKERVAKMTQELRSIRLDENANQYATVEATKMDSNNNVASQNDATTTTTTGPVTPSSTYTNSNAIATSAASTTVSSSYGNSKYGGGGVSYQQQSRRFGSGNQNSNSNSRYNDRNKDRGTYQRHNDNQQHSSGAGGNTGNYRRDGGGGGYKGKERNSNSTSNNANNNGGRGNGGVGARENHSVAGATATLQSPAQDQGNNQSSPLLPMQPATSYPHANGNENLSSYQNVSGAGAAAAFPYFGGAGGDYGGETNAPTSQASNYYSNSQMLPGGGNGGLMPPPFSAFPPPPTAPVGQFPPYMGFPPPPAPNGLPPPPMPPPPPMAGATPTTGVAAGPNQSPGLTGNMYFGCEGAGVSEGGDHASTGALQHYNVPPPLPGNANTQLQQQMPHFYSPTSNAVATGGGTMGGPQPFWSVPPPNMVGQGPAVSSGGAGERDAASGRGVSGSGMNYRRDNNKHYHNQQQQQYHNHNNNDNQD